ncbi:prolyl oligopeptidase, partial [Zopfia rhizophila CBS 207.26]
TLKGHTGSIMSTVFSPDDKYIALSSWDQSLKLWNASSGEQLHDFGPTGGQNLKAPFSPDGKYVLATAAGLGLNPKVKNLVCDDPNADHSTITPFPGWVRTVAWSPDKEYLAACSWHGKIIV